MKPIKTLLDVLTRRRVHQRTLIKSCCRTAAMLGWDDYSPLLGGVTLMAAARNLNRFMMERLKTVLAVRTINSKGKEVA